MSETANIIAFYPHNFIEINEGTHMRFFQLARYFRDSGFYVDLLSIDGFTNNWDEKSINKGLSLFNSIHTYRWEHKIETGRLNKFIRSLPSIKKSDAPQLPDFAQPGLRSKLRQLTGKRKYDFFLNSYVYWGRLADDVPQSTIKIIDLHDFITLNEHMRSKQGEFRLGSMFQEEINLINKYEYALSISEEETLFLEPFCSHTHFLNVPVSFPERGSADGEAEYDILFIGSDNPFNQEGMSWFMNNVYPLLDPDIKICIVGKITRFIEQKPNIQLVPYAENLDDVYNNTKLAFCPLKSGTGLKVKTAEALSFGKPLVTTKAGLRGILQKENNGCIVTDRAEDFAGAITSLLRDKTLYTNLQQQSINFFNRSFSREIIRKRLDSIFKTT